MARSLRRFPVFMDIPLAHNSSVVDFEPVADDVFVLRCPVLDVNSVLVVGRRRALLVDTLSTPGQAGELATAVRRLTRLPVTVVNTHYHFDHVFGNRTVADLLGAVDFWAHEHTITLSRDERMPGEARRVCQRLAPEIADEVGGTAVLVPNRPVHTGTDIDLGGRTARLWHPGPAHTHGDVIVFAGTVTIAGDLVEESGPPSVEHDSDAANWPTVLTTTLPHLSGPVIPGHGAVVDADFVRSQAEWLRRRTG